MIPTVNTGSRNEKDKQSNNAQSLLEDYVTNILTG
jgi:hypothetical protein